MPTALTSKSSNGRLAARSWTGLRGRVEDADPASSCCDAASSTPVAIADVELVVHEARCSASSRRWFQRVSPSRAEEVGAHVVVDAMDLPAQRHGSASPPPSRSARSTR